MKNVDRQVDRIAKEGMQVTPAMNGAVCSRIQTTRLDCVAVAFSEVGNVGVFAVPALLEQCF